MRYLSTRSPSDGATLSAAIEQGLAQDGGLYVPDSFPKASREDLRAQASLPAVAASLLKPFFEGDSLAPWLPSIAAQALSFPTPLKHLSGETAVLELFHGPTAAFKDVGARFLAGCLGSMPLESGRIRTVLVATSGDTGGAVASAFHKKPGTEVVILFPGGGVSPFQEHQLTCYSGNVRSFKVRGTFDDCQRIVKQAFAARGCSDEIPGRHLTSANSINIGRLLPQMVYYAAASLEYEAHTNHAPGFVIPTGNVGNAMAAIWVMMMGLPIREVLLATNMNRVVPEYFESGVFRPMPSVKTLANAMDVGNPSNLERLIGITGRDPSLRDRIHAVSVSDSQIRDAILQGPGRYGETWCPHTAAAIHARERQNSPHWIAVATAHPAKFADVVEPLLGRPVEMPPQLRALLDQPSRFVEIDADYEELRRALTV
jgi:threonine synthase